MKTVLAIAHAALVAAVLPLVHAAPAGAASPDDVVPLAEVAPVGVEAVSFSGLDVFPGYTEAHGTELWVSDGTAGGTHEVLDLAPGTDDSDPEDLAVFRGRLYFAAWTPGIGRELWSTDGTAEGTRLVADIDDGPGWSTPTELTVAGDRLWFAAGDSVHGRELWSSDGTRGGTKLVNEIIPGIASSAPSGLTVLGNRIVYKAFTSDVSTKPFVSGTDITAGIRQLDPLAFDVDLRVGEFAVLGDKVVFRAGDARSGSEIWISGGQPGDAHGVKDIYTGAQTSSPSYLTTLGDRVFFAATSIESGRELWSTDGTEAGTVQVRDIDSTSDSSPRYLTRVGDQLVFSADDGVHGRELWATGGSAASTHLVSDSYAGPASGITVALNGGLPVAGQLLYAGTDSQGIEPWVTDGFTARRLADLAPGLSDSRPAHAGVVGNAVLFRADVAGASRAYAWTAVGSTTSATAKRKYTAVQARKKRIALPVTVRSEAGTTPSGGTVTLTLKGRKVGSAALVDGRARVRITVRLKPGKTHRVVATWSGVQALATGSTSRPVKIRIQRKR